MVISPATKVARYRDEIHGDVILDPLAVALINTASLQRLGRIYQLGYTHLVYRGATHTRLSHVIGAYHIAGRFVDYLRENYRLMSRLPKGAARPADFLPQSANGAQVTEESRWLVLRYLVQWAALLHDVGHIPLGHTLEDEFEGIFIPHDDFHSPRLSMLWWGTDEKPSDLRRVFEQSASVGTLPAEFGQLGINAELAYQVVMSICLFKEKRESGSPQDVYRSFEAILDRALKADGDDRLAGEQLTFVRRVRKQLDAVRRQFAPYMVDIVSNTICADYMDYVRRDTTNTGLDRQTDDRILSQFLVGEYIAGEAGQQYRMALLLSDGRGKPRLDACTGVVDLVRRRFRLAEIIYYHKTKVSASAMLAKALSLIGRPAEVPATDTDTFRIGETRTYADLIMSGKLTVAELRRQHSPNALLSPEIGDESLLVWLQERAWEKTQSLVTDSRNDIQNSDERAAKLDETLRGIGLLQLIVRRRLYKVCAQIGPDAVAHLTGVSSADGEGNPEQIKRKIKDVLQLRGKANGQHERRAMIERKMAEAADWPADSLLIYVPPQKSQAKGIETRALSNGAVVTLGEHPAVLTEVHALNRQYERLWRVILLVHPDYQTDELGLSRAIDVFLREVWGLIPGECEMYIRQVARFAYVPEHQREGARLLRELCGDTKVSWNIYLSAPDTVYPESTVTPREQAFRAYLMIRADDPMVCAEQLRTRYPNTGDIEREIIRLQTSKTKSVEGLREALEKMHNGMRVTITQPAPVRELSETAFEDQCRSIFRPYIPPEDRGHLRSHHRDFIARNRARSPRRRYLLVEQLRKYDLSNISGISPKFNRENVFTEEKLKEVERSVDESYKGE